MTPTPQEIAARLSEAEKRAVREATPVQGIANAFVLPVYRDGGAMSRSLIELGLAGYSSRGAALNRKGRAVRDYLRAQQRLAPRTILETPDPGQCICTADYSGAWEMNSDCPVHNPPNSRLRNRKEIEI